ncbi:accessory factor UbiK family protein [Parasphingopyxis lamellibrachiae]|uniref:BMFP domain-containing protein YqiC n=1 Tax=Parasphingopyxis lamellibrachiae TaxID=680125 RepID=A0A3D9FE34_9SPHN|nr:accessory factor UbiK family protein [Parasphingopyxis lamellibrachiae]RED16095.1 BMFP domain-containing protein YqiC [Parasphingopyxis lamellibrachiae]
MQTQNKLIDDFVKMVNSAAGTLAGVGREAESSLRDKAKDFVGGMDFVSREEFEAVKEMAAAARDDADALKARLDALEAGKSTSKSKASASKTTKKSSDSN